jgi:hypothetical protein
LGARVTKELLEIWEGILSDAERRDLLGPESRSETSVEKLDALILKQAETMGWRLALSELVRRRFSEWDISPNGAALFEQYGKAVAKAVRRFQRLEPPPLDDPNLYRFKQESVPELRMFLRSLRTAFSRRRVGPSSDELIEHFKKTILAGDAAFLHLKTNIDLWVMFFRTNSTLARPFLLGKRASPGALFDCWFAWTKGLEPETIRQKISELGKFVDNSQKF